MFNRFLKFSFFIISGVFLFSSVSGRVVGTPQFLTIPDFLAQADTEERDIPGGSGLIPPKPEELPEELRESDLRVMVLRIVNYALTFLGLLAVVVIVYGGILMVASAGEEEGFKKGKTAVTYALVGIVIILLAYSIVNFVLNAARFQVEEGAVGQVNNLGEQTDPQAVQTQTGVGNIDQEINDLLSQFADLQNQILTLQGMDENTLGIIDALQNMIDNLAERIPNTSENQTLLNQLQDQINQLSRTGNTIIERDQVVLTPEDEQIITSSVTNLDRQINQLTQNIQNLPVMVARVSANQVQGNSPLTVVLDGRASADPSNITIPDSNYHWSYLDNNGQLKVLPNKPIVEVMLTEPAKYVVKLRVETANLQGGNKTAIDGVAYMAIAVDPPSANLRVTVNGKEPIGNIKVSTTQAKAGLSFDPSSSTPGIGRNFVSFDWDFGDNTRETYETNSVVSHQYNQVKDYKATLTVLDDNGEKNRKIINIKIQSLIADILMQPETGNTTNIFVFDSSDSYADEGRIIENQWSIFKAGQVVIQSDKTRFEYQFDEPGNYEAHLKVIDSLGREDLTVLPFQVESQAPIAFFTAKQVNDNTPSTFIFDAVNSLDRDEGDIIKYNWDFDSDNEYDVAHSDKKMVAYRYKKIGKYNVKLMVEDSFGKQDEIIKQIEVKSILDVDFVANKYAAHTNDLIKFGAKSDRAVSYYWYFADGTVEQTENKIVSHKFVAKGRYQVTLTAFDRDNNETSVTKDIYIGTQDNPVAIVKAIVNGREEKVLPDICGTDKDGVIISRNDNLFLDAGLSINIDGSNIGLAYSWDLGDKEYSTSKRATHRYPDLTVGNECNEVRLIVKDRLTGKTDVSGILYARVINKSPTFSKFIVKPPTDKKITPIDVDLELAGPHDFDGKITRYRFWYYYSDSDEKYGVQVVDKPFSRISVLSRGYEGEEYEVYFGVEVIDNDGGGVSNFDLGLITSPLLVKSGANMPPEVEIKTAKTVIKAGDGLTFYAEATDPQGVTLANDAYAWDFDGDGKYDDVSSGSQVTRVYNIPGEYAVRVKVTSAGGLATTVTHTIFVERISKFPVAAFLYEVNDLVVKFDATNSRADPALDNINLKYVWDFDLRKDSDGDGDAQNDVDAEELNPIFTYENPGQYQVKLTIADIMKTADTVIHEIPVGETKEGVKASSTLKIKSTTNPLTTLDLAVSDTRIKAGEAIIIESTILNADGSPYRGTVLFQVSEGTGEFLPSEVVAVNSKAKTIFKSMESGRVMISVIATEAIYGEIWEEVMVEVQ